MRYADIVETARAAHLDVLAGVACDGDPGAPPGARTLILLGPGEPGFWASVTMAPEFGDGAPDPLDRWSRRVIGALAERFGGSALFPFGGPPHAPFLRWAVASGHIWTSPVGLLVHARAGLWVSFRGAVALPFDIALPAPPARPCDACPNRPCLSACPVGALGAKGYDLGACRSYLDGPGRSTCMAAGCDVRRACPAGAEYGRLAAQSAYHMDQFHT